MKLSNIDTVVLILYRAKRPLTIEEIYRLSRGVGKLSGQQIRSTIFNDRYKYERESYFIQKTRRVYGNEYHLSKHGINRAKEILGY